MTPGERQHLINGKSCSLGAAQSREEPKARSPALGSLREPRQELQQEGVSRLYSSNLDSGLLGLLIIFCLAGDDCLNYYFFSHYNYKENKRRNAKRENKMKNKQTDLIQNKLKYFNFLMLISSFW